MRYVVGAMFVIAGLALLILALAVRSQFARAETDPSPSAEKYPLAYFVVAAFSPPPTASPAYVAGKVIVVYYVGIALGIAFGLVGVWVLRGPRRPPRDTQYDQSG
ncbi:MAG: hypothetical protein RDV41_12600 [Planctomycetota bacterium]|nr:hypothetical protein [Planctomycetota bacterium]